MSKLSRRALARYAADELLAGKPANQVAKALAASLKESGRSGETQFLVDDIVWQLENRQILAIGRITSVHNLSAELKQSLSSEIKKITRVKKVLLEQNLDKSVLGGLRVETSTRVWDETVAKKLAALRESS